MHVLAALANPGHVTPCALAPMKREVSCYYLAESRPNRRVKALTISRTLTHSPFRAQRMPQIEQLRVFRVGIGVLDSASLNINMLLNLLVVI